MRFIKAFILALVLATFGGTAYAVTFNGQDYSPEYTTGITEVYAVTENGVEVYVPVYSMEYCAQETGEGQVACVWNAQVQGNGIGQSFVKLGGNEFANITVYAAEILAIPGASAQPVAPVGGYTHEELSQVVSSTPTEVYAESLINEDTAQGNVYPMCVHEDGSGQGDCVWVSSQQGNQNGAYSTLYQNGQGTNISNEYAESIALSAGNTDHEGMGICELEEC